MTIRDFSHPVHRSLMCRELIFGIPATGMLLILIVGTLLIFIAEQYLFGGILLIVLYLVMRVMTKKDAFMVDILLESLNQKDVLVP